MAKRPADADIDGGVSLKSGERPEKSQATTEAEDFEDDFEDEFESEDEIIEAGVDGRPDHERETEEKANAMDVDKRIFIPGRDKLQNGESLSPDSSAYDMLHTLTTTWPCLSFDIVPDSLGENRKHYPATLYAVAGTQADSRRPRDNEIMVMKLSGLSRTERPNDSESSDDDDGDEPSEPILETKSLSMDSTTNRIRAHQFPPFNSAHPPIILTATMTESASLLIHNVSTHLASFDTPGTIIPPSASKPIATLTCHRSEGYALAWSPTSPTPRLLSGDNDGKIFLHSSPDAVAGKWTTDSKPFIGHSSSVEDIQWSPSERTVFASSSSDGTVRIWNTAAKSRKPAITVQVSDVDVNVLSWNPKTQHLLATGADDGTWAVWDLRQWKAQQSNAKPEPVAKFSFHKEQITSLEWHPTDDSIVLVGAGDNTLTLWDLAVEMDEEEARGGAVGGGASAGEGVPSQLLFVHYVEEVREGHWHPQIPGCVMATGGSGFGVFKTISV